MYIDQNVSTYSNSKRVPMPYTYRNTYVVGITHLHTYTHLPIYKYIIVLHKDMLRVFYNPINSHQIPSAMY